MMDTTNRQRRIYSAQVILEHTISLNEDVPTTHGARSNGGGQTNK
jgi:hypothetical protein